MARLPLHLRRGLQGRGGYLEIWRIAYPLIIMSAGNTVMQFVDRKFLAANSTLDVAAAMPAGILYFTLFSFFMVTANFTSALVAQYFGAERRSEMLCAVWTGLYFAVGAALLIVFALPPFGEWLIGLGGHAPELTAREIEYFRGLIPSGAFACLAAPLFSFFSGRGRTAPVAAVNTAACLLNVPLDYVFIFGWGGIPPLGIFGAGIATSLCSMGAFLTILWLYLGTDQREYPTRTQRRVKFEYLKRLVGFGTPSGLQCFFDVGAFTLVTFMIGHLGARPLAAHVIALSINNMFFIPLLGLSDATSILAGQYIGRRRPEVAEQVAYRAWRLGLCYMCGGAVVYWLLPTVLASMFGPDVDDGHFRQVVEIVRLLLATAAFYNFADTMKFIFMGALRGAGDTRATLLISTGCAYLVMVPGVCYLIMARQASAVTVWIFLAGCAVLEGSLILWRFRTGRWRAIRLIGPAASDGGGEPKKSAPAA